MDGPPIENGAVAIEGNRVVAVAPCRICNGVSEGPVLDIGERVLLPGLINAHCHLDYSMMRGAIARPKQFTAWVQRINALKRSLDSADYLAAIQRGFGELRKWGTTSVCNIEAFPELMTRLGPSPVRTWWFYEMIDIRHRITTDDVVAEPCPSFSIAPTPSTASA
ncbi:MAG: amidohydrolase family protein [Chthoniobacter sp.]